MLPTHNTTDTGAKQTTKRFSHYTTPKYSSTTQSTCACSHPHCLHHNRLLLPHHCNHRHPRRDHKFHHHPLRQHLCCPCHLCYHHHGLHRGLLLGCRARARESDYAPHGACLVHNIHQQMSKNWQIDEKNSSWICNDCKYAPIRFRCANTTSLSAVAPRRGPITTSAVPSSVTTSITTATTVAPVALATVASVAPRLHSAGSTLSGRTSEAQSRARSTGSIVPGATIAPRGSTATAAAASAWTIDRALLVSLRCRSALRSLFCKRALALNGCAPSFATTQTSGAPVAHRSVWCGERIQNKNKRNTLNILSRDLRNPSQPPE